jgi:hypothetical protein
MRAQCQWCDAPIPLMARTCPECGAANPTRRALVGAVVTVAFLIPAVAIAIFAATRWDNPLIAGGESAVQSLPSQQITGSDRNFDWLAAAMKSCDGRAASEPNVLNLLVVPITYNPQDLDVWRRQALNRIGNAMVLPSTDMLDALRRNAISIAPEEYAFSVRDGKSQSERKWTRLSGVRWLTAPGAEDFSVFSMQYKPRDKGRDDSWGNPIVHQKGNCYWVNAAYED